MMDISISPAICQKCPDLRLGCLQMRVQVGPASAELQAIIDQATAKLATDFSMEAISQRPLIRQTREAYKALGKKPGRYRPSAEALLRRIVGQKELYQINNVVDILNYISVTSGFSIGGYDLDCIKGRPELTLGIENEPYEAIARGQLNVGRLPVLRDDLGGFGSPTSDSVRTSVTGQTRRFLMIFFDFGRSEELTYWQTKSQALLQFYAGATDIEFGIFEA